MMEDLFSLFEKPKNPLSFNAHPHLAGVAGQDPVVVARRGEEAGDHQLPDLQARARRPVLRQDLRADEGLRVQLRQVQAHAAPRRRLREVRRRGHPVEGAPRAHGPHRPRHAGRAHLVPEEPAVAHRHAARHDAEGAREGPLLRVLRRHRSGQHARCKERELLTESRVPQGASRSTAPASAPAWAPRRSASC